MRTHEGIIVNRPILGIECIINVIIITITITNTTYTITVTI